MNENVALICRGKHFFFNLNFVEPQIHNLTLSSHNPAWWFAFLTLWTLQPRVSSWRLGSCWQSETHGQRCSLGSLETKHFTFFQNYWKKKNSWSIGDETKEEQAVMWKKNTFQKVLKIYLMLCNLSQHKIFTINPTN